MKANAALRLTNSKILNCAHHRDSLDLRDNWGETISVAANVILCCLQFGRGNESLLALHLTDLHKRRLLDMPALLEEIRKRMEGPPIIDGTNTPCAHTWRDFAGVQVCSNCGCQPRDLEPAKGDPESSDGH
jgi:hypothetical protein